MAAYVMFKGSLVEASEEKIARARSGIQDAANFIANEEKYSPGFRKQALIDWHREHIETLQAHVSDMKDALQGGSERVLFERAVEASRDFAERVSVASARDLLVAVKEKVKSVDLKQALIAEICILDAIQAGKLGVSLRKYVEQIAITNEVADEIIAEEKASKAS